MQINKVNELSIKMVKGDSLSFTIEIEELEVDLDDAFFTVKNNEYDDVAQVKKSLNNGICKVDTNKYLVMLTPRDTKYLDTKSYYYDLEITVGDSVYTVIKGLFTLVQDITTKNDEEV